MSEYQSQNNNYKISSSRESITNKGFGGLIIVRTTDVAFSTPTKIEKKKKTSNFKEIVTSFYFIVNEVSCKYFHNR